MSVAAEEKRCALAKISWPAQAAKPIKNISTHDNKEVGLSQYNKTKGKKTNVPSPPAKNCIVEAVTTPDNCLVISEKTDTAIAL